MAKVITFKCADCRVSFRGWRAIRRHTMTAHGREPNCDSRGKQPDLVKAQVARDTAAMNDGLMLAC